MENAEKSVVIFGGSGGIGSSVCKEFEKLNYHIIIADKIPPSFQESMNQDRFEYYELDVLNYSDIYSFFHSKEDFFLRKKTLWCDFSCWWGNLWRVSRLGRNINRGCFYIH